jgi:hypothetical protein
VCVLSGGDGPDSVSFLTARKARSVLDPHGTLTLRARQAAGVGAVAEECRKAACDLWPRQHAHTQSRRMARLQNQLSLRIPRQSRGGELAVAIVSDVPPSPLA